jgi:hypothetical protein
VDSVLLFYLCFGAVNGPHQVLATRGYGDDLFMFGLLVYSCMLTAMMYKAAIYTYSWTRVTWFFYIGR